MSETTVTPEEYEAAQGDPSKIASLVDRVQNEIQSERLNPDSVMPPDCMSIADHT